MYFHYSSCANSLTLAINFSIKILKSDAISLLDRSAKSK